MKRIAFHANQLGLRGTEVALYDYARYNEEILQNESLIISYKNSPGNHTEAIKKFTERFKVHLYEDFSKVDRYIEKNGVDVLYLIKSGEFDGRISDVCRSVVHVVFRVYEPHGHVYAYVSEWLSKTLTGGKSPYVPHMVILPDIEDNYRDDLAIPPHAVVFGRYGGSQNFDIPFVRRLVYEIAESYKHIYFLFMNTDKFCPDMGNIIHLNGTSDLKAKAAFINTCDAMLHAGSMGETFGLAVAEFSIKNKPVITWSDCEEKAHLEILKEKGIYYRGYEDLKYILLNFNKDKTGDWDAYGDRFSPEVVMRRFDHVFLKAA